MTQVSKIKLRPEIEKRIYELLESTLVKFKNKKDIFNFLNDFLSPIEKTILAKRLAIAVLLAKDNDYMSISNILRVTPNTITKMSLKMKYGNGSVRNVAYRVANSDFGKAIIEEIIGVFKYDRRMLAGEKFQKSVWERERRLHRLKKVI